VRLALQARPWPLPRHKSFASVGVSPPNLFFRSFFRSCPSVIRAEAALANASTGICVLRLRMEHRMKIGGDGSKQ
jgi:hypothetical protein